MDKSISHILIVDDDPNQLEILHEFLKRKGFQPVSAQSGSAALALSESDERIDVALIDLQLEDMSGLDVLRGIKEHSPKTECILLTGNASQKTAIEAIQLGAYGYFQKPFDIEQVHLFVQRAVEKQAVENALHESESRYRDLVENSQDLICTHDMQGNLLFVNEAGTKISGFSNETLLKMNLREILAPEARRLLDAYLAELQAKGQAHGLMRIQTAGGEIRYLEFKNTLQTEALTEPIARGMARDVTERKQAEDAMRASEANLKEAQRVGRIGSWDWDTATDTIHWSEEYYRIYCFDPNQPPPRYEEHLKVYTAESAARLDAAVKNSIQTGSPYELDLEFVCADGIRRWVTARSEIKRDAKGQIVGLRGTAQDITERKRAEEALRVSEEKYRTLIDQLPAIVYVDKLDGKGTTLFISPQVEAILGVSVKKWIEEDVSVWRDLIHPEDRQQAMETYQHSNKSGQPYELEYRMITRGGKLIWIQDKGKILEGSTGELLLHGVMFDITERKQAEDALYEQQQVFRTLVENSPDIIARYDRDCRRTYINPAYLKAAQISQQELLASSPIQHSPLPAASAAVLQNLLRKVLDSGVAEAVDVIWPKADNIDYWYNIYASPEFDREGRVVSVMTVSRDITERKKAEDSLRESEETLRESQKIAGLGSYILDFASGMWTSSNILDEIFGIDETYVRSVGNWAALVHPDERDQLLDYFTKEVVGKLAPFDLEYRIVRDNDKAERWVHGLGKLDIDERQQPIRLHGTILDITERKHAEQALAASEAELRALFASMQDVVLVIDREGVYRKIAPTNPSLLVMPPQELLNKNLRDVFPAEQAEDFLDSIRQVLETRKTAHIEYALTIGERTVWFSTSISPIAEDSTLWVARDITERKQAEEALRTSQERFKTMFEQAPLGIALVGSLTGHIYEVNQRFAEIAGRLMEEMLNIDWMQITHPDDLQADLDNMVLLNAGKINGFQMEKRYLHPDGTAVWINMTIAPLSVKDKAHPRHLCMVEDITKRKQAEEEIRQRVTELETLNHVSVVLRTIASQDQMLAIVLEETLKALHAENGSIQLWNKATNRLHKSMARGWPAEVTELPQEINEGIAGRVFTGGENHISRDMLNDPVTRAATRSQIPPGWGGICVPIRSAEQTLGTLFIAIPGERELNKDEIRLLNTLAEMTGASLHRMSLYEEAVHRMKDLQALRDVEQAITSNFDLRPTLDTIITHTIAQLGVDAADILLLRPHLKFLEYAAGRGFRTPSVKGASVRLGDNLAGRAALERRTIHISSLTEAQVSQEFAAFWKSEDFASYFCAPLLAKGEVKGVLEVYQRKPLPSEPEWLSYLETLAGQAAIAIDSTQLFDNLQRANLELGVAYETTIESWSQALSLRDAETESHTQHVTEMVITLARSFNFSKEEMQHIRRGAVLHDIGKMGVPDQILLKPGPLTDEEWIIMRRHPQLAYDMLKSIDYLHSSLDIPYCHHEKWDGSGYPRGLAGENIPLMARIFAIVDVYDALTNDRPYRKAWSNEKALEYIREQSGKHFDPQVVNAFLLEFGRKRSIVSGRSSL